MDIFWGKTPLELFHRGGWVMYPLAVCSVLALALIVDRLFVFMRKGGSFRSLIRQLGPLLKQGRIAEATQVLSRSWSPVARVAETYLAHLQDPAALREEVVSREASMQLAILERRMSWLAMVGHLSPMLGLLGTVTGLVTVFNRIEMEGGTVHPLMLAQGVWEALLTTVFGLVIALPAIAVYSLFDSRVASVALQMQWMTAFFDEWLGKEPSAASKPKSDGRSREQPEVEVTVGTN